MPKTLVIVESPGKIKKITECLGPDYVVKASIGHIRDIPANPKTGIGLSTDGNFTPDYQFTERGASVAASLKAEASRCDNVLLATDPDREGEAISWHLALVLKLDLSKKNRITFNEITKPAILAALKAPRQIDLDLVNAQQARRSLDRLIGYTASPILGGIIGLRKISAGRVQSPATMLVVDREREIKNFVPTTHFGVRLHILEPENEMWTADWDKKNWLKNGEQYLTDRTLADEISKTKSVIVVSTADTKESKSPPPPFTTSTMQQVISKRLSISVDSVMKCAQHLYEEGLITYHRSDTPNISDTGYLDICNALKKMGLPSVSKRRTWNSKGNAQEAHEAVRPSHADDDKPVGKNKPLTLLEEKVYHIIRERALACQMPDAVYAVRTIILEGTQEFSGKKPTFTAKGRKNIVPGWTALTKEDPAKKPKKDTGNSQTLPDVSKNQNLNVKKTEILENTTTPPSRYTEATLVNAMEKHGIGRPSTYASIIGAMKRHDYVTIEAKTMSIIPTDIAFRVIDEAKPAFSFVKLDYTAKLEKQLDEIAEHKKSYKEIMTEASDVLMSEKDALQKKTIGEKTCPKCGSPMIHRMSKAGTFFWGCSSWPKCDATLPSDYKTNIPTGISQKTPSKTRKTTRPRKAGPTGPTKPRTTSPKGGSTKKPSKSAPGGFFSQMLKK